MSTDVENKSMRVQLHGVVFTIMALVGSLMAVLPAIMPPFLATLLPALIILICGLVYYLWGGAGKAVKIALAVVALLMGLWMVINLAVGIAVPEGLTALVGMAFAGIGGLIALVGAIFGIVAAAKG